MKSNSCLRETIPGEDRRQRPPELQVSGQRNVHAGSALRRFRLQVHLFTGAAGPVQTRWSDNSLVGLDYTDCEDLAGTAVGLTILGPPCGQDTDWGLIRRTLEEMLGASEFIEVLVECLQEFAGFVEGRPIGSRRVTRIWEAISLAQYYAFSVQLLQAVNWLVGGMLIAICAALTSFDQWWERLAATGTPADRAMASAHRKAISALPVAA